MLVVALGSTSQAHAEAPLWNDRFRRFEQTDWAITGGLATGIAVTYLLVPYPEPRWRGGVWFDGWLVDHLRAETPAGRRRAARISDWLLFTSAAWPFADAGGVVWGLRGDEDTAAQIAMISVQSFLATAFVKLTVERVIARERPFVKGCVEGKAVEGFPTCDGSGNNKSFFSGHTSTAFTGAGLTCAHHGAMAIYGTPWDGIACATALAFATTTGLMRMVADEHYGTDVITGAILGLASGFVLPRIAHYRLREQQATTTSALVAPIVSFGGAF